MVALTSLVFSLLCATLVKVQGQLTGSVGPTTALSAKSKLCSVLDYGGSVGSDDIGPAVNKAFTVRIPFQYIILQSV
jgi:rhamnogalacturonan hydrolase